MTFAPFRTYVAVTLQPEPSVTNDERWLEPNRKLNRNSERRLLARVGFLPACCVPSAYRTGVPGIAQSNRVRIIAAMVIDLLDANESTWAFVVTDSVDADVGQQVTALATLANEGRCLDLLRTDCGRFVRSHLSGERRCSPYEAHVSRSSGHPPPLSIPPD